MSAPKETYLPSLDGIRAVAVIVVFISHAGWDGIVPGGLGVTIFFFLSGYLITTILRKEYESTCSISLKNFYLRRVYRIMPPMYLVLLIVLLLWKIGIFQGHITIGGLAAQAAQMTNYYLLAVKEPGIAPHTSVFWSLAVEEHFYLLFPVFFVFCLKRWTYPTIARLFLTICLCILIWRCVIVLGFRPSNFRTYWGTDTRIDSILFGCIMGIWMNPALDNDQRFPDSRIAGTVFVSMSVILLVISLVFRNNLFRETVRYTLQGIALFPLFWFAVRHAEWSIFKPLNAGPARFVGLVSYTFYLSHTSILELIKPYFEDRVTVAFLGFMMTVLFSSIVYFTVELPFARLRRRLHARSVQSGTISQNRLKGLAEIPRSP
jgi:peptidoglycan/LPS O-acetylase OafA/YrhL